MKKYSVTRITRASTVLAKLSIQRKGKHWLRVGKSEKEGEAYYKSLTNVLNAAHLPLFNLIRGSNVETFVNPNYINKVCFSQF
jgi:hypothetical protein